MEAKIRAFVQAFQHMPICLGGCEKVQDTIWTARVRSGYLGLLEEVA